MSARAASCSRSAADGAAALARASLTYEIPVIRSLRCSPSGSKGFVDAKPSPPSTTSFSKWSAESPIERITRSPIRPMAKTRSSSPSWRRILSRSPSSMPACSRSICPQGTRPPSMVSVTTSPPAIERRSSALPKAGLVCVRSFSRTSIRLICDVATSGLPVLKPHTRSGTTIFSALSASAWRTIRAVNCSPVPVVLSSNSSISATCRRTGTIFRPRSSDEPSSSSSSSSISIRSSSNRLSTSIPPGTPPRDIWRMVAAFCACWTFWINSRNVMQEGSP